MKIKITKEDLDKINKVYIVACATAYHAGLVGKYAIEKFAKIPVIDDIASEFRYSAPFVDENTLIIIVSQSGEIADTLTVLRDAKAKGARVIAITQEGNTEVEKSADGVIYIPKVDDMFASITCVVPIQLLAYHALNIRGLDVDKPRNLAKSVIVE